MKANDFLHLLGEIDDDLIVNAKKAPALKRSPAWRKTLCIAAAACLMVGILTAMIWITMREIPPVPPIETDTDMITNQEITSDVQEETTVQDQIITDGAFLEYFSALQYGSAEASGLPSDHKNNFSYNEHDYQDESVNRTLKVNMRGTEYELTYEESSDGPLYYDTIHKYSDGVREQWFDENMEKCVYYYNPYRPGDVDACSKEKQMEIAYAFLESQVTNPEQYQITREDYISDTNGLYIHFTRMNNGIATCDRVILRINKEGVITLFKLEHINEMSNVQPLPEEIIQSANIALENEVQSIYRQLAEQQDYEMTYKAEIEKLVRLDDGRLAFDCHVEAKVTTPDGEILTEGAWFIIPITEPTVKAE